MVPLGQDLRADDDVDFAIFHFVHQSFQRRPRQHGITGHQGRARPGEFGGDFFFYAFQTRAAHGHIIAAIGTRFGQWGRSPTHMTQ